MPKVYVFFIATEFKTGKAIRLLTRRDYNHVAFSFRPDGGVLYSYARYRYHEPMLSGFGVEYTDRYALDADRVGLRVCELEVSEQHIERIHARLARYAAVRDSTRYNFLDLLVYPFHRHVRLEYTHTCISFLLELLELGQVHTIGQLENLLAENTIFKGLLADYFPVLTHGPVDFFERRPRRMVAAASGRVLCSQAGRFVAGGLRRLLETV